MNATRRISVLVGVMFIVATVAGVAAVLVLGSIMEGPDYLTKVAGHPTEVAIAGTLEAVMGLACAGIAMSIYPVLRQLSPSLAIGAVGFRIAEAVVFLVAATAMLALVTLSQDSLASGTIASASTRSATDLLRAVVEQSAVVAALPFGLAALLYYSAFWQTRLLPRWLSGWGLAAIALYLAVGLGAMLTRTDFDSLSALLMPLALQEMVLAVWLIAKGFNPAAVPAVTAASAAATAGAAAGAQKETAR